MTKENNLDPVVQAVWPDYDEYWASLPMNAMRTRLKC